MLIMCCIHSSHPIEYVIRFYVKMVQWMTVSQKFDLIQKHRQNPSLPTRKLALWAHETFNLPTVPTVATVSRVLKSAKDIEDKQRHGITRKGHGVSCPELDMALRLYVENCAQNHVHLTRRILVEKAREILETIPNAPVLSLSAGWLTSFIRRHGMGLRPRSMQTDGLGGDTGIQNEILMSTRAQNAALSRSIGRKSRISTSKRARPTQLGLSATPISTLTNELPFPVYTGPNRTVLITGADNKTGVAFVRFYIQEGWNVIAACPEGDKCVKLTQLSPARIIAMDPGDHESVVKGAEMVKDVPIDLLIHNARLFIKGYLHSSTPEDCIRQYQVNALGPFLVARALLQNLRLGVRNRGMAFVVNISSRVGSIRDNVTGGSYGFRASITALHMFTKTLVADFLPHKIGCVLLHSGVDDKPVELPRSADVWPEESVARMAQIIARSRLGEPLQLRHFGNGDIIDW
ncbi:putative short-chain dehydrogenase/reductase SDR, HTH CenpB-type DNA-binding protein [Plasmopara halstedii]